MYNGGRASRPDPRFFARFYDVEDGFAHDLADEVSVLRDEFRYEAFGGCITDPCRVPGSHFPSQRASVEMMEDSFVEPSDEKGAPT